MRSHLGEIRKGGSLRKRERKFPAGERAKALDDETGGKRREVAGQKRGGVRDPTKRRGGAFLPTKGGRLRSNFWGGGKKWGAV